MNTQSGEIVRVMRHDAWGRVLTDTNPGFSPHGFAGGLADQDTKLVRFGARDYSPELGRWVARDPIGFEGGDTNLMAYAGNDPVNAFDPMGTDQKDVDKAVAWLRQYEPHLFENLPSNLAINDDNLALRRAIYSPLSFLAGGDGAIAASFNKFTNDIQVDSEYFENNQCLIVGAVAHELMHAQDKMIGITRDHDWIGDQDFQVSGRFLRWQATEQEWERIRVRQRSGRMAP